jgi:hypothetical protein
VEDSRASGISASPPAFFVPWRGESARFEKPRL